MRMAIITIVLMVGALSSFQVAIADDMFYSGGIVTESVGINLDIEDNATANSVFLLKNSTSEEQQVNLQFEESVLTLEIDGEPLENPAIFNPGERRSVNATFKLENEGETTKTLNFDPTLLLDGKPNSEPAGAIMIEASLPEGVNGLIWSNIDFYEANGEEGRKFYSWKDFSLYLTPITLKWSTLGIDLNAEKSASPEEITTPDQVINIQIMLTNNGNTELTDIILIDQYVASDFGDIQPATQSGTREMMLFWEASVDSLGPGDTTSLDYSVKYIAAIAQIHEFDLDPTIVIVDGNLASVSNRVRIKQNVELPPVSPGTQVSVEPVDTPEPEDDESSDSSWLIVPVIVVPVLIIAGGAGYFFWKRRESEQGTGN